MSGVKRGPKQQGRGGRRSDYTSAKKWKSKRRGVTVFERQLTKRKNWLVGYEQSKKDKRIRRNISTRHYHKAMKDLLHSDREMFGNGLGYRNTWSKKAFIEQDSANHPQIPKRKHMKTSESNDYNPSQSDWSMIDSFINDNNDDQQNQHKKIKSDGNEKKADSSIDSTTHTSTLTTDEGMPDWAREMQSGQSTQFENNSNSSSSNRIPVLPTSHSSSASLPSAFISRDRKSAGKRKRKKKRETLKDVIRKGKEARFERSVAELERKKEKLRRDKERRIAEHRRKERESIMTQRNRNGQPLLHKQMKLLYGQILRQHNRLNSKSQS